MNTSSEEFQELTKLILKNFLEACEEQEIKLQCGSGSGSTYYNYHLRHEFAHYLFWDTDDGLSFQLNDYSFNHRQFRLASRYSYSPQLELHFQQKLEELEELGISVIPNIRKTVSEIPFGINSSIVLNINYCESFDELIENCKISIILISRSSIIASYLYIITYVASLIADIKKLTISAIRMQFIANYIHNKISSSPTFFKKEPPIGGVKVGGKQHEDYSHVAEKLYLEKN